MRRRTLIFSVSSVRVCCSRPVHPPAPIFLSMLKDPDAKRRNEGYEKLVKAAASGDSHVAIGKTFGLKTIFSGLATDSVDLRRRYAKMLAELLNQPGFRLRIVDFGQAEVITRLLFCEDQPTREHVRDALVTLAAHDPGRSIVIAAGPKIMDGLNDSDPHLCRELAQLLGTVAAHPEIRMTIARSKKKGCFMGAIRHGRDEVGTLFRDLASYDDTRRDFLGADVVPQILDLLNDPAMDVQKAGVVVLGLMAEEDTILPSIATTIATVAVMDRITRLLADPGYDVQHKLLAVALRLTLHDNTRAAIVTPELCRTMVQMLQGSTWEKEMTLLSLRDMIANDDIRLAVATPAMMEELTRCLGHQYVDVQRPALDTILALADYADTCAVLVASNLGSIITKLLAPDSRYEDDPTRRRYERESTLKSMDAIGQKTDLCIGIAAPEVIQEVARLLGDPKEEIQQAAVKVILSMASYGDTCAVLTSSDLDRKLIEQLQNWRGDVREAVLKSMDAIIPDDDIRRNIATATMIDLVIQQLGHKSRNVQRAAATLILSLVNYADTQDTILALDLSHEISALLQDESLFVREATLNSAALLIADSNDMRRTIVTTSFINEIINLLKDTEARIQYAAVHVLQCLSNHDDTRAAILTPELASGIIVPLQTPTEGVRHSTVNFLGALFIHDDISLTIATPAVIHELTQLLGNILGDTQGSALRVTLFLTNHDSDCHCN
ncbi:armadillo-type protein [Mycena galopus ATCC 62051]|nr:armadillo-type protein [Mycena galopus ATCC 62051]